MPIVWQTLDLEDFLPAQLPSLSDPQTALPAIAKNAELTEAIEEAVGQIPTQHNLFLGDARSMNLKKESIHLVVTSPPYWTLKDYRETAGQLGHVRDYESFLDELDHVWK